MDAFCSKNKRITPLNSVISPGLNLVLYVGRGFMKRRALAAKLLLLIPICAGAQTIDTATRELIEKLQARIDSLEKRIAEIENEKGPRTAAAPAKPAAPPVETHAHDQAPAPQLSPEQPTYPALKIAGFADVDFAATNLKGASGGFGAQTLLAGRSGFALGQTTLHFMSPLSSRASVMGELSFTAR